MSNMYWAHTTNLNPLSNARYIGLVSCITDALSLIEILQDDVISLIAVCYVMRVMTIVMGLFVRCGGFWCLFGFLFT